MPHTARLRRTRGSVMVALPEALLDAASLGPGQEVTLSIEGGRIVIVPRRRPRYTLDELLARCDPKAPVRPEDREWLSGPAIGRELI